MPVTPLDVDGLLRQLSLEEKVQLLAGQGSFKTTGLPERGIPQIVVSFDLIATRREEACAKDMFRLQMARMVFVVYGLSSG